MSGLRTCHEYYKMEKGGTMIPYMDPLRKVPVLQTNQTPPQQQITNIQTDDLVTVLFTATSARRATQQTSTRKIIMLLGKEHSTLLVRTESCITLVGVSSKCAYMSSGSYMYSSLNYRTLATVLVFVNVLRGGSTLGRLVVEDQEQGKQMVVIPTNFHLSVFFCYLFIFL